MTPVVYYNQDPPPESERAGCLDVWLITRAVLGILLWPLLAFSLLILDIGVIFVLLTTNAPLALIPIALTVIAVWLFARWDQRRSRPPDV
jgi:hypothetical protein